MYRRICNPAVQQFVKSEACIVEKKVPRDCKSYDALAEFPRCDLKSRYKQKKP
jgi:hypothetical protein